MFEQTTFAISILAMSCVQYNESKKKTKQNRIMNGRASYLVRFTEYCICFPQSCLSIAAILDERKNSCLYSMYVFCVHVSLCVLSAKYLFCTWRCHISNQRYLLRQCKHCYLCTFVVFSCFFHLQHCAQCCDARFFLRAVHLIIIVAVASRFALCVLLYMRMYTYNRVQVKDCLVERKNRNERGISSCV